MFDSVLFYFISNQNQNLKLRMQYPSFTRIWVCIVSLFSSFKASFFLTKDKDFFCHYHRRGLKFSLKILITLSPTSVTCRSDRCHRWQLKPKPSYFHHFAGVRVAGWQGGRVAAVHEETSPPPRWRQWQRSEQQVTLVGDKEIENFDGKVNRWRC